MATGKRDKPPAFGGGEWLSDVHRRQRRKNIALVLALLGFALLFYLITIVRLGDNVIHRIGP
ncbi:MAG: hypothetical protein L6R19_11560 [Alphaproteobacteria bacterium]|nr:hypothetical protein [Alphaproteobacteria bacterium]